MLNRLVCIGLSASIALDRLVWLTMRYLITVRPGGKILCVGTLDRRNEIDMKIGIRKRLSIIFTYGGQQRDLVEVLDLISRKVLQPQVELGKLSDFPQALKDLGAGKIKDRISLVSDIADL